MSRLAVFFPGIGYHNDKPLLYFGRKIARECGYENFINVTYTFNGGNIRGDEAKMKAACENLYDQAFKQLESVNWNEYEDVVFISKSIGTAVAAKYAKEKGLDFVRQVLYTPLEQTFDFTPKNAMAFIGTCDPWSDLDKVKEYSKKQNVPLEIYEGLNHSLENEDTLYNLEILKDVIEKTRNFLTNK